MRIRHTWFLLLTFLLVGCSAATPGPDLVLYLRIGGIAGLDDLLTIRADGTASLVRGSSHVDFTVELALLDVLYRELRASDFSTLQSQPKSDTQGADLLEYTVVYRGHKVRVADPAVPARLAPVLGALDRIIASAR